MHVFQSKKVYRPGDSFALFGAGAMGEPLDMPYLFAVQLASDEFAWVRAMRV